MEEYHAERPVHGFHVGDACHVSRRVKLPLLVKEGVIYPTPFLEAQRGRETQKGIDLFPLTGVS